MKLTFLGCGDSFADRLGNNSALLEWGNTNLLIDLPDSNYSRIKEIGKDYSDIQNFFITHLHGDHINGLERFAYYRKFVTPLTRQDERIQKANLFIPETLYHGLWDSVKNGLGITANGNAFLTDYFNVYPIQVVKEKNHTIGKFFIQNQTFYLTPSEHVPNMPVYGLLAKGEFYYSADSIYNKEAISFYLKKTKKVFHDMHFYPQDLASHASIRNFSSLETAEKEKLYAMHYDDSQLHTVDVNGIRLVKPFKTITI